MTKKETILALPSFLGKRTFFSNDKKRHCMEGCMNAGKLDMHFCIVL